MVRRVRHVVPSQVVPEGVGEWPEEAGVAGGGGCGWGRGPLAVVGVEVPAVGAVGEAVRGSHPTCSFGSGTSHSGFTRFNPVELGRGAVEPLNRG